MPIEDEDFSDLYLRVCDEWDKAEGVIKRAELILGQPVIPSILELRYAGRRMIECHRLIQAGNIEDVAKAKRRLQDALFDCRRAQHDAIDVLVSSITIHVKKLQKKVPPHQFSTVYPKYPELLIALDETYEKIISAREQRENRDEFYQSITTDQLDRIHSSYSELLKATPKIRMLTIRDRLIKFLVKA